ncbi:hypothetical protein AT730_01240 [Vibrio alginolyticus]|nr:hypothetical protein AT730_01240 [Vibrio alginolyticus]
MQNKVKITEVLISLNVEAKNLFYPTFENHKGKYVPRCDLDELDIEKHVKAKCVYGKQTQCSKNDGVDTIIPFTVAEGFAIRVCMPQLNAKAYH